MTLRFFFQGSVLASLLAHSPAVHAADPPASPGFRLSDHELQDATAIVDEVLRSGWHDYYLRWVEGFKKNWPNKPVPPEEVLRDEASDEDFIRRATLDATDVIPTGEEVRVYLADSTPGKRHQLVDRLLLSPRRTQARFNRYASMLRLQDKVAGQSQEGYIALIRAAAETNAPFDELVRTLLTASGNVATNPAVGFLLRDQGNLLQTTDELSWSFLRENMHCTVCHDHPFSEMTELSFYEFAACFGATKVIWQKLPANNGGSEEVWPKDAAWHTRTDSIAREGTLTLTDTREFGLRLPYDWKYRDLKPNQLLHAAAPLPLNIIDAHARWTETKNVRDNLARWLITSERFAEVAGLREWDALFGTPPVAHDDSKINFGDLLTDGGPNAQANLHGVGCSSLGYQSDYVFGQDRGPSDTKFIRTLSALMRHVHFDLREFQRVIMHTRAYSRMVVLGPAMGEPRFGAPLAPFLRPLSPEQLWNSLVLLGGVDEGQWRFASELQQTLPGCHPLRVMGRGPRVRSDDSINGITYDLVRLMMTGDPIRHATSAPTSVVRRLETQWKNAPVNQVEPLFLAILGRMPTEQERTRAIGVATQPDGLRSLAWSLLNTGEFLFER